MKTILRIGLLAALLGGASYGQRALLTHLQAGMLPAGHQIAPPATSIPKTLGDWHGEDERLGNPGATSNGSLRRNYFHAQTGQVATLYLTYSPAGERPEGAAEVAEAARGNGADRSIPRELEITPGVIASQACLISGTTHEWLFRWSYALPPRHEPKLDPLQTLHRRQRIASPHVTIDVFVPDNFATDPDAAREFVRLVDAAVRPLLGPQAVPADVRTAFNTLITN